LPTRFSARQFAWTLAAIFDPSLRERGKGEKTIMKNFGKDNADANLSCKQHVHTLEYARRKNYPTWMYNLI